MDFDYSTENVLKICDLFDRFHDLAQSGVGLLEAARMAIAEYDAWYAQETLQEAA